MSKRAGLALVVLAALAACSPPKYAHYESVEGDFSVSAPWGWDVMTESDGDAFSQVEFIGPFDPDFFLGAPSLSVRWYRNYRPHKLRDGRLEMYAGADDFIRQTLRDVYGGDSALLYTAGPDGRLALAEGPETITLKTAGAPARFFVVLSPTPAPAANEYGLEEEAATGRKINMRQHAYVVVPMKGGFYVLCYPATRRGYAKYEDRFRALFGSFRPASQGPGGEKIPVRVL